MSLAGATCGERAPDPESHRIHPAAAIRVGDGAFPIQFFCDPDMTFAGRRVGSSACVLKRSRETIEALNLMAGYPTVELGACDPSSLHQALCERVVRLHAEHRPPCSVSSRTACGELLGRPHLGYDVEDSPLRSYASGRVSWPAVGTRQEWIADRLNSSDQLLLSGRDGALLLPQTDFEEAMRDHHRPTLFMDEVLKRNRKKYIEFVLEGTA